MESLDYLKTWMAEHATATELLKYVVWLTVIIFGISFLRRLLKRRLPDISVRYKAQKGVVKKYYIEDAVVAPTLAITMTDNWMQFNLRYIVDYKKRRFTKHILNEKIGKAILASEGKVRLASATFEIVQIPPVKIEPN